MLISGSLDYFFSTETMLLAYDLQDEIMVLIISNQLPLN